MMRRLFSFAVILSLLLCAATAGLWARSCRTADLLAAGYWNYRPHLRFPQYRDADMVTVMHRQGGWTVALCRRGCVAGPTFYRAGPGERGERLWLTHPGPNGSTSQDPFIAWTISDAPAHRRLGFGYGKTLSSRTICFPDAAVMAAMMLLPACSMIAIHRKRRRCAKGLCIVCGYDLRASSGRCPECGTPTARNAPAPQ